MQSDKREENFTQKRRPCNGPYPSNYYIYGQSHAAFARWKRLGVAREIVKTFWNGPFHVMVLNTSSVSLTQPKNMMVTILTKAPSTIVPVQALIFDSIDAVPICKGSQERKLQFANYQQVTTNETKEYESDWKIQLILNLKYDEYRQQFKNAMEKYVMMWNGHFGKPSWRSTV